MAVTWNLENANHLLRRAALGGTPEQVQEFLDGHGSVGEAVDDLLSFKPSGKKPAGPKTVDSDGVGRMQRWWFKQMIKSKTPADACREKFVLFLHNHLASGSDKQPTLKNMAFQNRRFRLFAPGLAPRGSFKDLIREFNRDPANLYYLDGIYNVASTDGVHATPNENFGRELMELFTLGVFQLAADGTADPNRPNYTEGDVHNMARACTGWTGDIKGDTGTFNPGDWDGGQYDDDGDDVPDPMTIFGQSSNNFGIDDSRAGGPDDVLELIFSRTDYESKNQVGVFISKKLWTWYAYPAPAPGLKALLNGFADTFESSGFQLKPVLQAMWTHDEFYSNRAKSRTVRNPTDYIVQAFRSFGVRSNGKDIGDGDRELGDHARIMGMNLFEPPNVAGWPGGLAWINSSSLLARAEFAKELAEAESGSNRIRLSNIAGLIGNPAADPADVVDKIVAQLGLDQGPSALTSTQKDILVAYANDGNSGATLDLSSETTDDARIKLRGVISLVLQCAENQVF